MRTTKGCPGSLRFPDSGISLRTRRRKKSLRIAAGTFETHDAIMITDAEANIIKVNRAFTSITGYSPEEVLGEKSPAL
ncbi:MAG: PAS domain S-box protein [Nitrosomonadales bacterium]